MKNAFITNVDKMVTLKDRLQKLINVSEEMKFLAGFFYFSGWKSLYEGLKQNDRAILKVLVGLEVCDYLGQIIEIENKDATLSRMEHFDNFIKSLDCGLNNSETDNQKFYDRIDFLSECFLKTD